MNHNKLNLYVLINVEIWQTELYRNHIFQTELCRASKRRTLKPINTLNKFAFWYIVESNN